MILFIGVIWRFIIQGYEFMEVRFQRGIVSIFEIEQYYLLVFIYVGKVSLGWGYVKDLIFIIRLCLVLQVDGLCTFWILVLCGGLIECILFGGDVFYNSLNDRFLGIQGYFCFLYFRKKKY